MLHSSSHRSESPLPTLLCKLLNLPPVANPEDAKTHLKLLIRLLELKKSGGFPSAPATLTKLWLVFENLLKVGKVKPAHFDDDDSKADADEGKGGVSEAALAHRFRKYALPKDPKDRVVLPNGYTYADGKAVQPEPKDTSKKRKR